MKNNRISIDPGVSGTGWALWPDMEWPNLTLPSRCGIIKSNAETWQHRTEQITKQLRDIVSDNGVIHVYCEYPQHFESVKGNVSEASGDLIKLAYLVGMFGEMCRSRKWGYHLVPVNVWKGQLPKDVVKTRLLSRLPGLSDMRIQSHAWDAIGIGLYAKGYFKCYSP